MIVGYTYKADTYCPECMGRRALNRVRNNGIPVRDEDGGTEHWLTLWAILDGIDRSDEHMFDSDDFPKVIDSEIHNEAGGACGDCAVPLDGEAHDRCPACGQDDDYCQGHGLLGDPIGYRTLRRHDVGDHSGCRINC